MALTLLLTPGFLFLLLIGMASYERRALGPAETSDDPAASAGPDQPGVG